MEAYLRKNPVLLLRAVLALVLIFGLISPVQSAKGPVQKRSPRVFIAWQFAQRIWRLLVSSSPRIILGKSWLRVGRFIPVFRGTIWSICRTRISELLQFLQWSLINKIALSRRLACRLWFFLRKYSVNFALSLYVVMLIPFSIIPVEGSNVNTIPIEPPLFLESKVSCQLSLQVSCDVKMWQEKLALQPVNLSVEALPDAPTISQKPAVKPVSVGGAPPTSYASTPSLPPSSNCSQYLPLVSAYNWPVDIAMAIMRAESGCNPNAINYDSNGTVDRGLMQINSVHGAASTFDPVGNVHEAYVLYSSRHNFTDWSTYNSGAYLKYL